MTMDVDPRGDRRTPDLHLLSVQRLKDFFGDSRNFYLEISSRSFPLALRSKSTGGDNQFAFGRQEMRDA